MTDPLLEWSADGPPNYTLVLKQRLERLATLRSSSAMLVGAKEFYRTHPVEWIEHFAITYDPRKAGTETPAIMPFILFPRQKEAVEMLHACVLQQVNALFEKARDMGLTWLACAMSVWLWLYWPGAAVGWGSRKEQLVDKLGDPDSIFEKMRMIVRFLPREMLPAGFTAEHMNYMKIINPETGASITGESGDNIGRGGRKLIFWKDESSHYERPEKIEAALADNTNCQIDISSVNGLGNVFHRRRESGVVWTPGSELSRRRVNVFIMDWRDHPAKTQAWYDERREKAENEGILHLFKQEVDRDYAASVEGIVIPSDWVKSAIDAHLELGIEGGGVWSGALDVAGGDSEGTGDTNASAWFEGIILRSVDNWGARDTGATTRRAVEQAEGKGHVELQYDCIGVGAGVKGEANRLEEEGILSPLVRFVPWNAAAKPLDDDKPMIPDDRDSPLNGAFYENLKAQAWWRLRMRFERTHRAVLAHRGEGESFTWEPEELISIDSRIPLLRQVEKELSQPTAKRSTKMKLVIDKTPEGTRSPNIGDAIVMAANPATGLKPIIAVAKNQFEISPFKLPQHFRKAFAMKVVGQKCVALWSAWDQDSDVLYVTTEYVRDYAEPSVHAAAIRARGAWIPGVFDCDVSNLKQFDELIRLYAGHGIAGLAPADQAVEAGIGDLQQRISTGRLKAFSTCVQFFTDYRGYRRGEDGGIVGGGLMDCARQLARPETLRRAKVEPVRGGVGQAPAVNLYR